MSEIIFFSVSKQFFFCRNDVQAIDFLRKGSYAPAYEHMSPFCIVVTADIIMNVYLLLPLKGP